MTAGLSPEIEQSIAHHALRFPPHVREDMMQEARLAVVKLASRFDSSRGVKFRTFAAPRIQGAMRDLARRDDPNTRRARKECAVLTSFVDLDALKFHGAPAADFTAATDARRLLALLPARDRRILTALYLEERSPAEIASAEKLHLTRVYQLHAQALQRLRKNIKARVNEL